MTRDNASKDNSNTIAAMPHDHTNKAIRSNFITFDLLLILVVLNSPAPTISSTVFCVVCAAKHEHAYLFLVGDWWYTVAASDCMTEIDYSTTPDLVYHHPPSLEQEPHIRNSQLLSFNIYQ